MPRAAGSIPTASPAITISRPSRSTCRACSPRWRIPTRSQTYLESRHPQNAEYQALRVELEALKASEEDTIVVDPKLLLKPGETSPELPKLMQIVAAGLDDEFGGDYGETLATFGKSETYIPELVPVVKEVQKRAGLKPDGVVGPRTVAALAGTPKADRIDKVIFALEELRWLPSDLGSPRVFINEPAFTASFIEGGEEKLKMNVVVGKPGNQTAFFYRDDRAGRLQSLLGRAALDPGQRDAAEAARRSRLSRPRRLRGERLQGPPHLVCRRSTGAPTAPTFPSTSASRPARPMRSAI